MCAFSIIYGHLACGIVTAETCRMYKCVTQLTFHRFSRKSSYILKVDLCEICMCSCSFVLHKAEMRFWLTLRMRTCNTNSCITLRAIYVWAYESKLWRWKAASHATSGQIMKSVWINGYHQNANAFSRLPSQQMNVLMCILNFFLGFGRWHVILWQMLVIWSKNKSTLTRISIPLNWVSNQLIPMCMCMCMSMENILMHNERLFNHFSVVEFKLTHVFLIDSRLFQWLVTQCVTKDIPVRNRKIAVTESNYKIV